MTGISGSGKAKKYLLAVTLLVVSMAGLVSAVDFREGVVLARFESNSTLAVKNSILNSVMPGATVAKQYTIIEGLVLVDLPDGTDVTSAVTTLSASAGFMYVEPDYTHTLASIPNDSSFSQLWGMNNTGQSGGTADADIDAPEAWDIHTGSSDIIVAVTDTGVDYTHPDLAANMWVNTAEQNGTAGVDDDGNGYVDDIYGIDSYNGDSDPADDNDHGTHCSGTIGGAGNNGQGVAGVCWTVRIMALKCFSGAGFGSVSAEIECIQYGRNMGADVMSASWGGSGYSQSLKDAISAAGNAGIVFVAAAGNSATDNDSLPHYPSSYNLSNIIAVLSTDHNDNMSGFSCYGLTSVDIGAPGSSILSCAPGGGYQNMSGTSMATPHVAGACALLKSINPSLTAMEIKDAIISSVDTLASLNGLCTTGGRLNVASAAVIAVGDGMSVTPDPMAWDIEPAATGTNTIYMEAVEATGNSGVEYYFECDTDPNFSSEWQSELVYERGDYYSGTTYTFRVKARDLLDNLNETDFSDPFSTTTAAVTDNLPPAPNPAQWNNMPKVIRFDPANPAGTIIRMSARTGMDESAPCQYYFTCTDVDGLGADASFDSGWESSEFYTITGASLSAGSSYTFTVTVRDDLGNATVASSPGTVGINASSTAIYRVPLPYTTIQAAIDATQNNGDTVVVRPGTYSGTGNINLDFNATRAGAPIQITVRSVDPEDRDIVAATVINCGGMPAATDGTGGQYVRRGFIFQNGETAVSVVSGFTIINGYVGIFPVPPTAPATGAPGIPGTAAYGGGISVINGSRPTISNCVIDGCIVDGSGSDGVSGVADSDLLVMLPGGAGGAAGNAGGGGIYCDITSSPIIEDCTIMNCSAIADGGNGGDGDVDITKAAATGGLGGAAAIAGGAGIMCDSSSGVSITNSSISGCWARSDGGDGGDAGPADDAGVGGIGGAAGSAANTFGGGIYCGPNSANTVISNCEIFGNQVFRGIAGSPGAGATPGANGSGGIAYGGGISNDTVCSVTISSTKSLNNISDDFGGGLSFADNCIATLTDCEISDNIAQSDDGGGIWFDHSGTLNMNGCRVTGNTAPGTYSIGGGLMAGSMGNAAATVNLNDSPNEDMVFSGNTADSGGGIYVENTALTILQSELSNNSANDGAGLFAGDSSTVTITDSKISDNTASLSSFGSGGGILLSYASSFAMTDSLVTNNNSNGYGGGLLSLGYNVSPYQIINCLFTDNETQLEGGALSSILGSWFKMTNCTVADNSVLDQDGIGGGIHCAEDFAYVEMLDCIIWNNTAAYGPQLAAGRFNGSLKDFEWADLDVFYCDVEGGLADVFEEPPVPNASGYPVVWYLGGNIDQYPEFLLGYFLADSSIQGAGNHSPCIDAGSGPATSLQSQVSYGSITTRSDFGIDQSAVDMGYHYDASGNIPQLTLTVVVVNPEGGNLKLTLPDGTIAVEPGGTGTYDLNQGQQIAVLAVPSDPNLYPTVTWTNTEDDTSNAYGNTVRMDTDKILTVEFEVSPEFAILRTDVTSNNGTIVPSLEGLYLEITPDYRIYYTGTVVTLTATPDDPTDVLKWFGTDNDYTESRINQVTLNQSTDVEVKFYTPNTLIVGPSGEGVYTSIQLAISDAIEDDIIMVMPGIYDTYESNNPLENSRIVINGKRITLRSFNPQDPSATTILGSLAIFDVDRHTVIDGFTITGHYGGGNGGTPNGSGLDGTNGGPISGGGMVLHGYGYNPRADTSSNGSPTVKNCVFLNCSVRAGNGGNGAGGLDGFGEPGHGGWGGYAHGGAVSIGSGADPKFINCDFIGNYARGGDGGNGGSAAPHYGGHGGSWGNPLGLPGLVTWENGPYEEYIYYSGFGGAVYCGNDSFPEFEDCNFSDNKAYGGSCGISGAGIIPGWPSSHYRIDRFGGAVFGAKGSTPKFTNCVFDGNEADRVGPATHFDDTAAVSDDINISFGGAVAFEDGSEPNFINCAIENNTATMGGGGYVTLAGFNAQGCTFEGNTALNGGAFLLAESMATITRTTFRMNSATGFDAKGGAIFSFDSDPNIIDCVFEENDTVGSGGAIYVSGADDLRIHNSLILNNLAGIDGGGISSTWYAEPVISNCNLINNVVSDGPGTALAVNYSSHATLINSIIWDTTLPDPNIVPYGLYVGPESQGAALTVHHSDIQGGIEAMRIEDIPASIEVTPEDVDDLANITWDHATNINGDPLFITGALGDYFLSQILAGQDANSPCVDAGDPNLPFDLSGYTTSTLLTADEEPVDIGMHYRATDESAEYTLTTEVVGPGGTIIDPGVGEYIYPGSLVTITALPEPGFRVKQWTGTDNDLEFGNTISIVMNRDRTVTVEFEVEYTLTIGVDGTGGTVIDPGVGDFGYPLLSTAIFTVLPDEGYRVKKWTGTDDDFEWRNTNTVFMNGDKIVSVEFEVDSINTINVPGDTDSLDDAVIMAKNGDVIMLASGTYLTSGIAIDKAITITGTNPDDPAVVNATVIEFSEIYLQKGNYGSGIYFADNTGSDTVLDGVKLANASWRIVDGLDGEEAGDHGGNGGSLSGGGIYIAQGASPTIKNCIVENCRVTGSNGGNGSAAEDVAADPDNGVVGGIVYGGNGGWGGYARGGGIYVGTGASPTFINCTVRNCTATGGNGGNGGAALDDYAWAGGYGGLWSDGSNPSTTYLALGHSMDYRYYSGYGGGVYCGENSSPTFIDCTITGNRTYGGISGVGGDSKYGSWIVPSTNYQLPSYGGGVYSAHGSRVTFEDCIITGNVAAGGSGASDPDNTETGVVELSQYTSFGGGVAIEGSGNEETSATFEDCTINDNDASIGGGVYWINVTSDFDGCKISGNTSYHGAGIYGIYGYSNVTDCDFMRNMAGIFANIPIPDPIENASETDTGTEEDPVVLVEGIGGIAGQGGGINYTSISANIEDSYFYGNAATASGGGILMTGAGEVPSTVKNCLIASNSAGRDGGGISTNWNVLASVENCTIVNNEVTGNGFEVIDPITSATIETGFGGGVYTSYYSQVNILNSIVTTNLAEFGSQISVGSGFVNDPNVSTVSVAYSAVFGGEGLTYRDNTGVLLWDSSSNIELSPVFSADFVQAAIEDKLDETKLSYYNYYLDNDVATGISPCVDAGSNLSVSFGLELYTTNIEFGDEFADSGTVDIGYHYPHPLADIDRGCSVCDLEKDGIIDFTDLLQFTGWWMQSCGSDPDCWNSDFDDNAEVDFADYAKFASCWFISDTAPPTPDVAQWAVDGEPAIVEGDATTVMMTAKRALDAWWGTSVEYQFEELNTGVVSGWITEVDFEMTNLILDSTYKFVVRARDTFGNITADSEIGYVWTSSDIFPPEITGIAGAVLVGVDPDDGLTKPRADFAFDITVDPVTQLEIMEYTENGLPYASATVGAPFATISMTAQRGIDPEGKVVEYKFQRIDSVTGQELAFRDWLTEANGGLEWADGNETANRLVPGVQYTYVVRMRDSAGNVSAPSGSATAIAELIADDMDTEAPPVPIWASSIFRYTCTEANVLLGECLQVGVWDVLEIIISVDPQGFGVEYYFENMTSGENSGWITETSWQSDAGALFNFNEYRVKARDTSQRKNESAWSIVVSKS